MKNSKQEVKVEPVIDQNVVDEFAKLWYPVQFSVMWMGHEIQKCPLDLFIYQEIIYECRPDLIIECGSWKGGSALYLAHLCDLNCHGMVLSIDINRYIGFPQHPRIVYLTGNSVEQKTIDQVKGFADSFKKVMVILDSNHAKAHVLRELELYSEIVSPRQYLIVEDTHIHGHPVREDHPAGPWEAVHQWLPKHPGFVRDKECERFLLTHNPHGYLRRIQ